MRKPVYPFTPDDGANHLLAESGTALLIGLCLEQQVRSEKAMVGPFVLRERIGHLDALKIARMTDSKIVAAFRATPAIHRFPGMMAKRVKALCGQIAADYDGDGGKLWERVRSADEVYRRLLALPGFGDAKASCGVRILAKFGKRPLQGWQRFATDEEMPWVYRHGKRVDT
jgi:uncharacterized HhH-GPD family protein